MTNDANKQELERTKTEIDEILRRVDSLPVLDSRPADEIIGYDEDGMPAPQVSRSADSGTPPPNS
jgi:hypothetical protein